MPAEPLAIKRPQMRDEPFSAEMSDADIDWLLTKPPLDQVDPANFPPGAPIRDILKNDSRILRCHDGEIIVRRGDYGHSAFLVLEGSVRVAIDPLEESLLGRREPQGKGFFRALGQLWSNPRLPEVRERVKHNRSGGFAQSGEGRDTRIFLQDVPAILDRYKSTPLHAGTLFGELAALGRHPRTPTVFADGECVLLEVRWQGLRDIRRWDDGVRKYIDRLYRERSLKVYLNELPEFRRLNEEDQKVVADSVLFETCGTFDWYGTFKSLAAKEAAERLEDEPVIAQEGHYADGLILIRTGFARLSEVIESGHRTVSYLGRGATFGFEEIAHNWQFGEAVPLQKTLRAVGFVGVLRVPTAIIEKYVLPTLPKETLPPRVTPRPAARSAWRDARKGAELEIGFQEFLVDNRFINGMAAMVIDLDRCTRCDECVRACAETHDNNPRFIRHGKRDGRYMIASACMHCIDPVCMIGCPTGTIHRDRDGGQVVINDATCIGCSTCANSCPYDNIRMVPIQDPKGNLFLDQETNLPIEKATKCDLCIDQMGGPACQRACPHDALIRMDLRDGDGLLKWVNR